MTDENFRFQVFKKFGLEKFDPTNEQFDPHRHNAVFQIPDASKEPGTVAVVLKVCVEHNLLLEVAVKSHWIKV